MHPTSQRVTPDHATREPQNAGLVPPPRLERGRCLYTRRLRFQRPMPTGSTTNPSTRTSSKAYTVGVSSRSISVLNSTPPDSRHHYIPVHQR